MDNSNATTTDASAHNDPGTGDQGNTGIDIQPDDASMLNDGTDGDNGTDTTGNNAGGEGDNGGEGATPLAGGDSNTPGAVIDELLFDGQPLPDFVPPAETETEKKLREEVEELRQQISQGRVKDDDDTTPPQRPDREGFYSDEEYDKALRDYFAAHDEWAKRGERQAQATAAAKQQFEDAAKVYYDRRVTVSTKLKEFDRYEQHADNNLNPQMVAAIVFGGQSGTFDNAPEMMYAIGRNPELLKKLNDTTNPFLAGAMLLDISKKARMAPAVPKPAPNPVPEVTGGNLQSLTAELQLAEEEAEHTGDWTKVIDLKGKIRNASK